MSVAQKLSSGTWRRYSADDGGYYYHNEDTDQSVWDPPPGWTDPEAPMMPAVSMEPLNTDGRAASGSTATSASDRPASPSVNSNSSRNGRSTVAHLEAPPSDTKMSQQEVASMRAETGGATPRREVPKEEPRKRNESDHSSSSSGGGGCCACCTCSCGTLILWLLLVFAIIILIVLAVVLTLPQSISCNESDKGYFIKIVDPPIITSALPAMFCTAMNGSLLTVNGSSFLVLNDHTPTVTLGNWTLNPQMYGCEDINVRKQDAKLCTGFTAKLPVDDGSNSRSPLLKIVNPKVDPHPIAHVSGTCQATEANQILLVQNPNVIEMSPASVCQGVVSNLTLRGGPYIQLLLTNTSEWIKPYIYANGDRISPDSIVLSDCQNITYQDFDSVQSCDTATIQLLRDLYSGQINLTISNPGGTPCVSGQTVTFYSLPPSSIDYAVPNTFCAAGNVQLFGKFYFIDNGTPAPIGNITVNGNPQPITAYHNCTNLTAFGYTLFSCPSINITYTPPAMVGAPPVFPPFLWQNGLPGCDATFYPAVTINAPTVNAVQTRPPVFCTQNPSEALNMNLDGTFFSVNGKNPTVALGTYSVPPSFVNPSKCQTVSVPGAPLLQCSQVQVTIPGTSVITGQTSTPRLTMANLGCTYLSNWDVPVVAPEDSVQVVSANPNLICNDADNVEVTLTGNFISYLGTGTSFTIGGVVPSSVTFAGCTTSTITAQSCTTAIVNVTGSWVDGADLPINAAISACELSASAGTLTASAANC